MIATKIKSHRFLVTGGAGFIGSNLVAYLLDHGAVLVRVLDNFSNGHRANIERFLKHPNFEFIEGDIRDFDTCKSAVSGMDYVSHQAALGSVPRSITDPLTTNAVNVSGFLNMLTAVKETPEVKRMVYAASSSTYGDSKALPKVEAQIGNPLSPYAVTKYVNELYANVFGSTYNTDLIGLRYFNVYGPYQSPNGAYAAVIPLFMQALKDGVSPKIHGDGEQTRDFTYVANAVQANIKAFFADTKASNQVYNVACGERISINTLCEGLKTAAQSDLNPTYVPTRQGDVRDSLADISKAERLLGYIPEVKVKEGLQLTWDWFNSKI
ncbi:SDR family oxidoreductase [Winogradskyella immobilis]|uniref:SDR family oxidoreductase n=1 Tax=Winogradskyella immobilis TaxID=2816852 RepID=A0ABS8ERI8_9FLAO|nr:SDR family oxidoreductase [Winogradskyella immobilis]MCC1484917.1 SDR family oxidoreductase [Winogradskyella immobilis]MCG0017009.1 SDR family oxidoreductase [Winogradskyella immobilis]